MNDQLTIRKWRLFETEFLPPIVLTVISLIIYIILTLTKTSFTSNSQIFLYIIICWIPAFFYLISGFRLRLPPLIKIGFYLYATCSNLLATTFNVYTYIPVFDTILHSLFGYIGGYLFIFVFIKSGDYQRFSTFSKVLVIFFATAAAGLLWEVCEYCVDIFTNANSQHEIETGLLDTMQDSFCNLGGAALMATHYLVDHLFFKNAFFTKIVRALSCYEKKTMVNSVDEQKEK